MMLAACSVTRMLPKGPVVDEPTRQAVWTEEASASGVEYTSRPQVDHPAVPFLVFGLRYNLDVVIVSKHPRWEMHEYARVASPDGPIWLAKDTRRSNGDQLLVGDRDVLANLLPEIPLARKPTGLQVDNQSTASTLDLRFRYENAEGAPVDVHYEGPRPEKRLAKRNGSTMGHSRHQVMAVLDLPNRRFGTAASISIGGEPYGIQHLLGLKPMRLAIRQTQGGIPEANVVWSTEAGADASPTVPFRARYRLPGGSTIERQWQTRRRNDRLIVYEQSRMRRLSYGFRIGEDGALELTSASVHAYGDDRRTFHIDFSPALPDLRRSFRGTHRSRFVMDVGGQRNHAAGRVTVTSDDTGATVEVRGTEPWWVADRCVTSKLDRTADSGMTMQTTVRPCR
ncbi:MAG: hypothetical protein ABEN55_09685 [Bradymonadaceae bacterium]